MKARIRGLMLSLTSVGAWCLFGATAMAQVPPPPQPDTANAATADVAQQPGVEVQTRGPVNEAFAEPTIRGPRPTPIVPKQPPDPIQEVPPDQRPAGDNVEWIPGYWAWDTESQNFLWVSGVWRAVPPGEDWIPGHWMQAQGGWQWVAGYWQNQTVQQTALLPQPPDPVQESVPQAPSATDVWVPGTWVYNQAQYMWRPGFWTGFRPGWMWTPAYYVWTPAGFIFVDGHWDYPLQTRGLLFAPVAIDPQVYSQPNWVYRPSYVVSDSFLMDALFVRPDNAHYYFGDYFDARYRTQGFHSWWDYSVTRRYHDPLFAYYRVANRDNPRWERDLGQVYANRVANVNARPARTLVQQNRAIENIRRNTTINRDNVTNLVRGATGVAPISRVNQIRENKVNLTTVNPTRQAEIRKNVQQFHQLASQRTDVAHQVINRGEAPTRAVNTNNVTNNTNVRRGPVNVDLNRVKSSAINNTTVKAPPRPVHPQPVAHEGNRPEARPPDNRKPEARPGPARAPETGARPPVAQHGPAARPSSEYPQQEPPHPAAQPASPPSRRLGVAPESRPAARPGSAHVDGRAPTAAPQQRPAAQPPAAHQEHQAAPPQHQATPPQHQAAAPARPPASPAQHQAAPAARPPAAPAEHHAAPAEHHAAPAARPPAAPPENHPAPAPRPPAEHHPAPAPAARPAEQPHQAPRPPAEAHHAAPPPAHQAQPAHEPPHQTNKPAPAHEPDKNKKG